MWIFVFRERTYLSFHLFILVLPSRLLSNYVAPINSSIAIDSLIMSIHVSTEYDIYASLCRQDTCGIKLSFVTAHFVRL